MTERTSGFTGYQQGVRCFFSIDMVNSTGIKTDPSRIPTRSTFINPDHKDWVEIHTDFYSKCVQVFAQPAPGEAHHSPWAPDRSLHLWRVRGDETLFYSNRVTTRSDVFALLFRFVRAVSDIDEAMREYGIGARGSMWAAGFPIRNREMIVASGPPFFRLLNAPADKDDMVDAPFYEFGNNHHLEFVGPEIDLGFMLSSHVNASRVVLSLDVADMVSRVGSDIEHPLNIHHVGWQPLKGLYESTPYPILWADIRDGGNPVPRVSYEAAISPLSARFFSPDSRRNAIDIQRLALDYLRDTEKFGRIRMYLTDDEAPASDRPLWKELKRR